ncbi:MAG TPA: hypothetical protein VFU43_23575 [Streptosporangiaceae bacterium]|nr:hypothetical protein [Streptosporangiaceae bacterium]
MQQLLLQPRCGALADLGRLRERPQDEPYRQAELGRPSSNARSTA